MPVDTRRVHELTEPWRTKRKDQPRMGELARAVGFVSQEGFSDLMRVRADRIRLDQLEALADVLGVPVLELLTQREDLVSVYYERGRRAGRAEAVGAMHDFLNRRLRE